jgi:8-oxo-dGTP pyrophosphatase MutT (NUDIX family)
MSEAPPGLEHVRAALALPEFDGRAAGATMAPGGRPRSPASGPADSQDVRAPREASALLYLFERDGVLHFPLTLRRADLPEHRGQVSFPGGRPVVGEDNWTTATREAHEEIGLDRTLPVSLGRLAPVWIPPTHTWMHVWVGTGPEVAFVKDEREVADVQVASIADLIDPRTRQEEVWERRGAPWRVPSYQLCGWTVWGATAVALGEFVSRLQSVHPGSA